MIIWSMYRQIWPNPIPNSNTWVYHPYDHFVNVPSGMTQSNPQFQYMSTPPLWSFRQCTVRYGPIQYPIPIHGCTTPMIILSMYRLIWPNPISNSNTWVHHPYDHLVNVPSDMTQSNTQFQYKGCAAIIAQKSFPLFVSLLWLCRMPTETKLWEH